MNLKGADQRKNDEEKIKEIVDKGIKSLGVVARRFGHSARLGARVIADSEVAQATAAASTEAARFALDRTFEVLERATDPHYGAFWEPRVDRFSMIPWYDRQLVEETCELPIDAAPPLLAMLELHVPKRFACFAPPPVTSGSGGEGNNGGVARSSERSGAEGGGAGGGGGHGGGGGQVVLPSVAEEERAVAVVEKARKNIVNDNTGDGNDSGGEDIDFHDMISDPTCSDSTGSAYASAEGRQVGGKGDTANSSAVGVVVGTGGTTNQSNPGRTNSFSWGAGRGSGAGGGPHGCDQGEDEDEEAVWLVVAEGERPLEPVPYALPTAPSGGGGGRNCCDEGAGNGCGGSSNSSSSSSSSSGSGSGNGNGNGNGVDGGSLACRPKDQNPFAAAAAAAEAAAAAAPALSSPPPAKFVLTAQPSSGGGGRNGGGYSSSDDGNSGDGDDDGHGYGDNGDDADDDDDDSAYALATKCIGAPPLWRERSRCECCQLRFGLTRYRHHCRACGGSFCHAHASKAKALPRLGFLAPVRCCDGCFSLLETLERSQRTEWRAARLQAFEQGTLIPYFDLAVDTHAHKARRLLEGTLFVARRAPLGSSATITVEVMDVLWRYGPPGLAGLVLRREFIEAAELLRKVSNVESSWPLSAHELMASLYYLLALKRGERGNDPDAEANAVREEQATEQRRRRQREQRSKESTAERQGGGGVAAAADEQNEDGSEQNEDSGSTVSDHELRRVLEVAPFALHFCYAASSPEMQLRAAQRGFWLLFAKQAAWPEEPAFALFAKPNNSKQSGASDDGDDDEEGEQRVGGGCAILSIRGTTDIYDVVTDIRVTPVPFPPPEGPQQQQQQRGGSVSTAMGSVPSGEANPNSNGSSNGKGKSGGRQSSCENGADGDDGGDAEDGWMGVEDKAADGPRSYCAPAHTVAVQGMANAAVWLLKEVGSVLTRLSDQGYEIVLTGHSLGGAVAALLSVLLKAQLPPTARVRVVTFGSPCCMDSKLAASVEPWVTSVVLHDDVVPRITPNSVRELVAELLRQRQGMVTLWHADLEAVFGRAKGFWAPRWRDSFLRGQDPHKPFDVAAKGLRSPHTSSSLELSNNPKQVRGTADTPTKTNMAARPPPAGAASAAAGAASKLSSSSSSEAAAAEAAAARAAITVTAGSRPIGTGAGAHDGSDLRHRFLLANDNARAAKKRQQQQQEQTRAHAELPAWKAERAAAARVGGEEGLSDQSLEDELCRGLQSRNATIAAAATAATPHHQHHHQHQQQVSHRPCFPVLRVGDRVSAWGIAVTAGESDDDDDSDDDGDDAGSNEGGKSGSPDFELHGRGSHGSDNRSAATPKPLDGAEAEACAATPLPTKSKSLAVVADNGYGSVQAGWYGAVVVALEHGNPIGETHSQGSGGGSGGGGVAVAFTDLRVRPAVSSAGDPAWKTKKQDRKKQKQKQRGGGGGGGAEFVALNESEVATDHSKPPLVFLPALLVQPLETNNGDEIGFDDDDDDDEGPNHAPFSSSSSSSSSSAASARLAASASASASIVVDALELPCLQVPGRVLHLYAFRGTYLASKLQRDSHILSEIKLYGNMLSDHSATRYFEALCECLDVRHAPAGSPPEWKPFSSATRCGCCRALFSWHATATSTAQHGNLSRDKHHCRCCGGLVCDPCSSSRRTLPRLGLNTKPQRVCDRCFFDADAISSKQQPSKQQPTKQQPSKQQPPSPPRWKENGHEKRDTDERQQQQQQQPQQQQQQQRTRAHDEGGEVFRPQPRQQGRSLGETTDAGFLPATTGTLCGGTQTAARTDCSGSSIRHEGCSSSSSGRSRSGSGSANDLEKTRSGITGTLASRVGLHEAPTNQPPAPRPLLVSASGVTGSFELGLVGGVAATLAPLVSAAAAAEIAIAIPTAAAAATGIDLSHNHTAAAAAAAARNKSNGDLTSGSQEVADNTFFVHASGSVDDDDDKDEDGSDEDDDDDDLLFAEDEGDDDDDDDDDLLFAEDEGDAWKSGSAMRLMSLTGDGEGDSLPGGNTSSSVSPFSHLAYLSAPVPTTDAANTASATSSSFLNAVDDLSPLLLPSFDGFHPPSHSHETSSSFSSTGLPSHPRPPPWAIDPNASSNPLLPSTAAFLFSSPQPPPSSLDTAAARHGGCGFGIECGDVGTQATQSSASEHGGGRSDEVAEG